VKAEEKRQARALFRNIDAGEAKQVGTQVLVSSTPSTTHAPKKLSSNAETIKAAIQNAKTLEEVQFLERSLIQGKLPKGKEKSDKQEQEEEEEEEEHMEQ